MDIIKRVKGEYLNCIQYATVCLVVSLLVACETQQTIVSPSHSAFFQAVPCWFKVKRGRQADCGYMHVPENRQKSDSRLISFPVVIYRAKQSKHSTEPVVLLGGGGPGSSVGVGPAYANYWWEVFDNSFFKVGRDVIIMEQRGVGESKPNLACWELRDTQRLILEQTLAGSEELDYMLQAVKKCRERLVSQGVDLTAYHSKSAADDAEDLRKALGYERWNIYGVSYGGRIALNLIRDYPDRVRSAILDSIELPEINFYEEGVRSKRRVLDQLLSYCETHDECDWSREEISNKLQKTVDFLNKKPVTLTSMPWQQKDYFVMKLTGTRFNEAVFFSLYDATMIPVILSSFDEVTSEPEQFEYLTLLVDQYLSFVFNPGWSDGLYYSVQCHEEKPYNNMKLAFADESEHVFIRDLQNNWVTFEGKVCEFWGAGKAPAIENELVQSDVPAIIFSGHFDPVISPEWGKKNLSQLQSAVLVEFPTASHDVMHHHPCAAALAAEFVDHLSIPTERKHHASERVCHYLTFDTDPKL